MLTARLTVRRTRLSSRFQSLRTAAIAAVQEVVAQATDQAVSELVERTQQQIALPVQHITDNIEVEKRGSSATITAKATPIPLALYPHRKNPSRGVDVVVNPGRVSTIGNAAIARNGQIIGFENGRGRVLFGPGVNQIADDEFPSIAEIVIAQMARELQQRFRRLGRPS